MTDTSEIRDDVMFSTAHHYQFFVIIILILVLFLFYFLYFFIKSKAFQDLSSFLLYSKVFISIIGIIIMILCVISQFIIVEITENAKYASIIFVLIVALLVQFYINITFSALVESNNKLTQYTLLIVVLYIAITGFGAIGLRLILNTEVYIPLVLQEKMFESNTPNGVRFMFMNVVIMIVIHGASYMIERKTKK